MKKCFSLCLVAIFLIVSSTVVIAMPASNPVPVKQQELPSWLAEVGAQIVPDAELAMVQGEVVLLSTLYYLAAVYGVPFAVNYAAYVGTQAHLTNIALFDLLEKWVKRHYRR